MNKFYKDINSRTNDKYAALRFPSVKVRGDFVELNVVCAAADREFVDKNMGELMLLATEICAFNAPLRISVSVSAPDRDALRADVIAFTRKFPFAAGFGRAARNAQNARRHARIGAGGIFAAARRVLRK